MSGRILYELHFSLFALMEQQGFPLNLGILRIKAR